MFKSKSSELLLRSSKTPAECKTSDTMKAAEVSLASLTVVLTVVLTATRLEENPAKAADRNLPLGESCWYCSLMGSSTCWLVKARSCSFGFDRMPLLSPSLPTSSSSKA